MQQQNTCNVMLLPKENKNTFLFTKQQFCLNVNREFRLYVLLYGLYYGIELVRNVSHLVPNTAYQKYVKPKLH